MEIQELRKKYGITQAQLAKMLGVSIKTVQRWEQGERGCRPYVQKLIAFYLEHTIGSGKSN